MHVFIHSLILTSLLTLFIDSSMEMVMVKIEWHDLVSVDTSALALPPPDYTAVGATSTTVFGIHCARGKQDSQNNAAASMMLVWVQWHTVCDAATAKRVRGIGSGYLGTAAFLLPIQLRLSMVHSLQHYILPSSVQNQGAIVVYSDRPNNPPRDGGQRFEAVAILPDEREEIEI